HSGGVDIVGPKINLNSGGSPGAPVPTLQPAVLKALADDKSLAAEQNDSNASSDQNDNNDEGEEAPEKSVCKECLKRAQEAAAAFALRG
ncbi:type VI secretion system tip protein VgrG, partial [Escherichia coli]|nr:type VI secretion system tip protein VgrG [Escherichia coli]